MKKQELLKRLFLSTLTLLLFCSFISAQRVGEECDDGKCDSGLYCVEVTIKGSKKKLCAECNQSKLDGMTRVVKDKCKFPPGEGFYPNKNAMFQKAISDEDDDQDRVAVTIFDDLHEDVKDCKDAREDRDDDCWGGGDPGHMTASQAVSKMNRNIADIKGNWIADRKVFYCSKSTYEGAMRAYNSKCSNLNTSKIEDILEDMEDEVSDEKKIDCDDLDDYIEDCEDCYRAAYALYRAAFSGSSGKVPGNIKEKMEEAEALQELGEEIMKDAKSDDLCD